MLGLAVFILLPVLKPEPQFLITILHRIPGKLERVQKLRRKEVPPQGRLHVRSRKRREVVDQEPGQEQRVGQETERWKENIGDQEVGKQLAAELAPGESKAKILK